MKISNSPTFLKQPPILPTPPFLWEKSESPHFWKLQKLNPPPPFPREFQLYNYGLFDAIEKKSKGNVIEETGFGIRGMRLQVHASAHTWNIGDEQKKARLVWLRKLQDVWQIAHLKQQHSLPFTFCKTKILWENHVYLFVISLVQWWKLKFAKLTGKYKCQSLFFNKFAGATMSLLILKIFEHSL